MKTRATLILIGSLILCASANSPSIGSVYAGNTDSVAELAGAQASAGPSTAPDKAKQTAPVPSNPCCSCCSDQLFSIGTAINGASRRLAAIRCGKRALESQRPSGLVGLEPFKEVTDDRLQIRTLTEYLQITGAGSVIFNRSGNVISTFLVIDGAESTSQRLGYDFRYCERQASGQRSRCGDHRASDQPLLWSGRRPIRSVQQPRQHGRCDRSMRQDIKVDTTYRSTFPNAHHCLSHTDLQLPRGGHGSCLGLRQDERNDGKAGRRQRKQFSF